MAEFLKITNLTNNKLVMSNTPNVLNWYSLYPRLEVGYFTINVFSGNSYQELIYTNTISTSCFMSTDNLEDKVQYTIPEDLSNILLSNVNTTVAIQLSEFGVSNSNPYNQIGENNFITIELEKTKVSEIELSATPNPVDTTTSVGQTTVSWKIPSELAFSYARIDPPNLFSDEGLIPSYQSEGSKVATITSNTTFTLNVTLMNGNTTKKTVDVRFNTIIEDIKTNILKWPDDLNAGDKYVLQGKKYTILVNTTKITAIQIFFYFIKDNVKVKIPVSSKISLPISITGKLIESTEPMPIEVTASYADTTKPIIETIVDLFNTLDVNTGVYATWGYDAETSDNTTITTTTMESFKYFNVQ